MNLRLRKDRRRKKFVELHKKNHTIPEIAKIMKVTRGLIYYYRHKYMKLGEKTFLEGKSENRFNAGRKKVISKEQFNYIVQLLAVSPKNYGSESWSVRRLTEILNATYNAKFSESTVNNRLLQEGFVKSWVNYGDKNGK